MCGRYSFFETEQLYERFRVDGKKVLEKRYNVAPSQTMPVVVETGQRNVVPMRWGLIPVWANTKEDMKTLINARVETIATKPTFSNLLLSRRCLVPANGFFEWDKRGKKHIPYFIRLKDGDIFGFAGLYNRWTDKKSGEIIDSYAIITTESENKVKKIHSRMPIILERKAENEWLDTVNKDKKTIMNLLETHHVNDFEMYPVSELANSPANDIKEIIKKGKLRYENFKLGENAVRY